MTLLLRTQRAQERLEGRAPVLWREDDYAVLDYETVIGRIYRERIPAGVKWRWFLHIIDACPNSAGMRWPGSGHKKIAFTLPSGNWVCLPCGGGKRFID
jgi:hypothetical protein